MVEKDAMKNEISEESGFYSKCNGNFDEFYLFFIFIFYEI